MQILSFKFHNLYVFHTMKIFQLFLTNPEEINQWKILMADIVKILYDIKIITKDLI